MHLKHPDLPFWRPLSTGQDFFEELADFKAEEEKVEDEPRIFCVSESEGVLQNDGDVSKARLKDFYWTSQG